MNNIKIIVVWLAKAQDFDCPTVCQIEQQKLIISKDTCCLLKDVWSTNDIDSIQIDGILQIKNGPSIYLKYKQLELGESGKILIDIDQYKQNQIVIFEQVLTEDSCFASEIRGTINIINSSKLFFVTNKERIQMLQSIEGQQSSSESNEDFDFLLIDFSLDDSYSNYHSEEQVRFDQSFPSSNLIPPIIALDNLIYPEGVIFLNSCLSFKSENLEGVKFINPQVLLINGKQMKNSILMNNSHYLKRKEMKNRSVQIDIQNSQSTVYYNLTSINIKSYNLSNSLFLEVQESDISFDNTFQNNYFQSSQLSLFGRNQNAYELNSIIVSNSSLKIPNDKNLIVKLTEQSYFMNSSIRFEGSLDLLIIQQSYFINSIFRLQNNTILKDVTFKQSYFFTTRQNHSLFLVDEIYNQKQDVHLTFQNCFITGSITQFITQSQSSSRSKSQQDQNNTNVISKKKNQSVFKIFLYQPTINSFDGEEVERESFNNSNLQRVYIYNNGLDEYEEIKKIEVYNIDTSSLFFNQLQLQYQSIFKDYYFTNLKSMHYSLIHLEFEQWHTINNYYTQLYINQDRVYSVIDNTPTFQIFQTQTQRIVFTDGIGDDLIPNKFIILIQSQQCTEDNDQRIFKLIFNLKQPILNIVITDYNDPNNTFQIPQQQILEDEEIIFFVDNIRNELNIVWKCTIKQYSLFLININYCKPNQFFDNGSCRNECDSFILGNNCVKNCGSADKKSKGTKYCTFCPYGCIECSNEDECLSCTTDRILQNGKCLDICPLGTFQKDKTCQSCQPRCLVCIDDTYCSKCFIQNSGQMCDYCQKGYYYDSQYAICQKCHHSCLDCLGKSSHQCTECNKHYKRYLSLCVYEKP